MALSDGRGVAYSYEFTVPAPSLPSSDQSYNLPRSYRLLPWSTLDLASVHALVVGGEVRSDFMF